MNFLLALFTFVYTNRIRKPVPEIPLEMIKRRAPIDFLWDLDSYNISEFEGCLPLCRSTYILPQDTLNGVLAANIHINFC
jgi:hypothetical protein